MPTIVSARDIGKKYVIGHSDIDFNKSSHSNSNIKSNSFCEKLLTAFKNTKTNRYEDFWALQHINFDVEQGERVGIIGSNGSGKSTLLKILSQITEPTTGQLKIRGRVASLLEVGTGFHPELTGRENIFLNGAILGMKRIDIAKNFDAIVNFAEITQFLDTPVKHYSSGMYIRLAFSVAAHLDTQILVVDEVLAVGDISFQNKCLSKMQELTKEGRTVLFVTHNMQALAALTEKCMVLKNGYCDFWGDTNKAIAQYLNLFQKNLIYRGEPLSDKPTITKVEIITSYERNVHQHGHAIRVIIEINTPFPTENASLAFQIMNMYQQPVLWLWRLDSEKPLCRTPGIYTLTCEIPQLKLYKGEYTITVHFSELFGKKNLIKISGICSFEVVMHESPHSFGWSDNTCVYMETSLWHE